MFSLHPTATTGQHIRGFVSLPERAERHLNHGSPYNEMEHALILHLHGPDNYFLFFSTFMANFNHPLIIGSSSPRLSGGLLSPYTYGLTPAVEVARPIAEMGLSELAHSLAWLQRQSRTLVVGMNQKQIKIFDLRGKIKLFCRSSPLHPSSKAVFPNVSAIAPWMKRSKESLKGNKGTMRPIKSLWNFWSAESNMFGKFYSKYVYPLVCPYSKLHLSTKQNSVFRIIKISR